ncbi:hypothetical protein [Microbacterium stercoris]|uniref:Uncharacterized protein n=1 Tax=Microbacterium stercoris TaxID=2820289 RepID=A0A939TS36_9MICO|nr:hypothetical protein [Microbacterium stercoris]MBO3665130.1 hypothetical protein [Microbacterium stercoris]
MVRRDLDLIRNVDESLRGDAYDLLTYASRVLEMLTRPLDPNGNPVQGMPEVSEMVDRTLGDAVRQSDALLLAMAPLLETQGASDTALAARIREEARGRWKTLPAWLDELEPSTPLEITGVTAIEHVLGAASTIVIGATLPDGTPATATVFIDRDGGHTIEDAFVAPEEFRAALAAGTKGADFDRFQIVDIDPADARERVFAALAADLALEPPLVTETWPGHRSLLAWILRSLPEGGSLAARPAEDAALDEQLVAAAEAAAPGTAEVARLLVSLNRERSGSGDPRLWSDTFVTDLLLDHLPFEDVDAEEVLAALPALVEAGHALAEIAPRVTADTLEAIEELGGEFLDLSAMEADGDLPDDDPAAHELAVLSLRVGGRRHLDALQAAPITRVVPDLRHLDERAAAGLARVQALVETAGAVFEDDPEIRIAAAGVADLLAETDPRLFAKGKPELAAAAIAWIAGVANDAFAPVGPVDPSRLMAALGLRGQTPAARAAQYLAALGQDAPETWAAVPSLGDPSLLTARTRRALIARRDEARAALGAEPAEA